MLIVYEAILKRKFSTFKHFEFCKIGQCSDHYMGLFRDKFSARVSKRSGQI